MLAKVPFESISKDDAEQFCSALEASLSKLSVHELKKLYLFAKKTVDRIKGVPCIVISFDGDWRPFLGHTHGWNTKSKPPRLAITSDSRVLSIVKASLQQFGGAGQPAAECSSTRSVVSTTAGCWEHGNRALRIRLKGFADSTTLSRWSDSTKCSVSPSTPSRKNGMAILQPESHSRVPDSSFKDLERKIALTSSAVPLTS